jgi:Concanavalin A-like lectin/glucanases superfamily
MAVFVSQYPTSLDTLDTLGRASNGAVTSLSAAISASDTAITVSSTAAFPSSGNFTIEDEIITYAAKTSNTFTGCVRGTESTTPASHPLGVDVSGMITAAHTNNQNSAILALQTKAGIGAQTLPQQIAALEARIATLEQGAPSTVGFYPVSDFSASGSRLTFTGTIQAGALSTLILTADSDFEVNQGVYIAGAAAAGAPLVTRITAISPDSRTLTLQTAASQAITAGLVQHDDTVAIQTAITTCFNDGGGIVEFDFAFYRVNGPVTAEKAILSIPHNSYGPEGGPISPTSPNMPITLRGCGPVFVPTHNPTRATVIQSDKTSTDRDVSILNCGLFHSYETEYSFWNLNYINLAIENIVFQVTDNPKISGLDVGMAFNCALKNVMVYTGGPQDQASEPTTQHFGLRLPRGRYPTVNYCEQVSVANFWTGVIVSELINANQLTVFACKVGIEKTKGEHLNYGTLCLVQNATHIKFNEDGIVDFSCSMESLGPSSGAPAWKHLVRHFDDPTDKASGRIGYINFYFDGGATQKPPALINGCSRMVLTNYADGSRRAGTGALTVGGSLTVAGPSSFSSSLSVSGATQMLGQLSIAISGEQQPFSAGTADSAGTGFRQARFPNTAPPSLLTSLVSFWKMNEPGAGVRADSHGAHSFSASASVASVAGKISQATYNTYGGGLSAPDSPDFNFSASGMTAAGWINIQRLDASFSLHTCLAKWGDTPNCDFLLYYNNYVSSWEFAATDDGDGNSSTAVRLATVPALNQWYFLAAGYDPANSQIWLQVDGSTRQTTPFAGPLWHSAEPLTSLWFSPSNILSDAYIDELGLWSRSLSQAEVATLYNSGAGKTYPFT